MCGDTGVPRWYVKIGKEAQVAGGPVAFKTTLRTATANATYNVPLRPTVSIRCGGQTTTTMLASMHLRLNTAFTHMRIGLI